MTIAYVDVTTPRRPGSDSEIIRNVLPQGFVLFIVGEGDGAMKHRIRELGSLEEAVACADFFAEHWHDSRASFEVWSNGQCVHISRPAPDDEQLAFADDELYGRARR